MAESFKASLDESLRLISDAEFNELQLMIEEAISDTPHHAAEMVEEVSGIRPTARISSGIRRGETAGFEPVEASRYG